ncbi:MAG: MarR family transcriptional regulator [Saprospiraceae bacterium]|nr:MarR family transcriptional regulator [Saprospiraceae bacterium]
MEIGREIQQKQFKSDYQQTHINILFTASWLNLLSTKLLKKHNISPQQFNILRILQGAHPKPISVKLLTERMIDKMSNASRLVEKLKQKGLIERNANESDRRRVDVYITEKGINLLEQASKEIETSIEKTFSRLQPSEALLLNQLLDKLRG